MSLSDLLHSGPGDVSDHDVGEAIAGISIMLSDGHFAEYDAILRDARAEDMGVVMMITALRTPYSAKERLPNWSAFRDRAAVEIARRGGDPHKALRGLGVSAPAAAAKVGGA